MAISAAPLTEREEAMARATKSDFDRAAAGQEKPGGSASGKQAERPGSEHNIEPPAQEKKAGAALDKSAGRSRFEEIKQSLAARSHSRSHDLSR